MVVSMLSVVVLSMAYCATGTFWCSSLSRSLESYMTGVILNSVVVMSNFVEQFNDALCDERWVIDIVIFWISSLCGRFDTLGEVLDVFRETFIDEGVVRPCKLRITDIYMQIVGDSLVVPNRYFSVKMRAVMHLLIRDYSILFSSCVFDDDGDGFMLQRFVHNHDINVRDFTHVVFSVIRRLVLSACETSGGDIRAITELLDDRLRICGV